MSESKSEHRQLDPGEVRMEPEVESHREHEPTPERPALTVFLMRHGESEEDKTKPNRGLTERGQGQVRENFNSIINQLVGERFSGVPFDDPKQRGLAVRETFRHLDFHLADSKTDRTMEQAWLERQMLLELGIDPKEIHLSRAAYAWAERNGKISAADIPENAGPGVAKRLSGVRGLDKNPAFRKKIGNPEYQAEVGAGDEIIAWALTPDDEVPEGVESKSRMEQRLQRDLGKVERVAAGRLDGRPKRVVYVANSHASILTLATSSELGLPMEQVGEVPNAEGLRFDFYGAGKAHSTRPFGKNLETKVAELQKE